MDQRRSSGTAIRHATAAVVLALLASPVAAQSLPPPMPVMFDIGEGNLKVAIGFVGLAPFDPPRFNVDVYTYPSTLRNHVRIAGIVASAYRTVCGARDVKVRVIRTDLPYERLFGTNPVTLGERLAEVSWSGAGTTTARLEARGYDRWPSLRQIDAEEFFMEREQIYLEQGMPDNRAERRALAETRRQFGVGRITTPSLMPYLPIAEANRAIETVANFDPGLRSFLSRTCGGYRWRS